MQHFIGIIAVESRYIRDMKQLVGRLGVGALLAAALTVAIVFAQGGATQSDAELEISSKIGKLRSLDDVERAKVTKELALAIRNLPAGMRKVSLASSLTNLSTEGDFGKDTLQEVTTTLVQAVKEFPVAPIGGKPAPPYSQLAALAKYEQMKFTLDDPQYKTAVAELDATDKARAKVDFTLTDLAGKKHTLSSLKGKVVLVNFWATWCPPCRKEMPDMEILHKRFKDQGLVILAISDEERPTIEKFITANGYTFPILLDVEGKVGEAYKIDGIPKSFIYDRTGKIVAQSIDMRTQKQFLDLLAKAGLK